MNYRIRAPLLAAYLGFAFFAPPPAIGSSVVVPDDVPTVQDAINSQADTVLIRPGTYLERPVVDRNLVIKGIDDQRPRLNGLDVENTNFTTPLLHVTACAFTGPVQLRTVTLNPRNLNLEFIDCTLDSGIIQVAYLDTRDIEYLTLHRSRIGASSQAIVNTVFMVADTLDGRVAFHSRAAYISECWFRGDPGRAITLSDETAGRIINNTIESYATGIYGNMEFMTIDSNRITDCGLGMHLAAGECTVLNNRVTDCGGGIFVGGGRHMIDGNTITNSGAYGIYLDAPDRPIVSRNVIGISGGSGVVLELAFRPTVRGNTLYRNGDAAIDVLNHDAGPIAITRNIGFENQTWGLRTPSGLPVQLSCNDWFNNELGATTGVPPGASDVNIDPAFCDVDSGDVSLSSDSALLEVTGCDSIGARGVGCGVTATVLAMLEVEEDGSANLLRWQFGSGEHRSCWVERSTSQANDWRAILGSPNRSQGVYEYRDTDVDPSRKYWYRIAWLEGAQLQHSAPIQSPGRGNQVAFTVTPNPSYGAVSIAWSQGSAGQVAVHIYDLSGREIAVVARGWFSAGTHSIRWDSRSASGVAAAPGWYGVRIKGNHFSATKMQLLLR